MSSLPWNFLQYTETGSQQNQMDDDGDVDEEFNEEFTMIARLTYKQLTDEMNNENLADDIPGLVFRTGAKSKKERSKNKRKNKHVAAAKLDNEEQEPNNVVAKDEVEDNQSALSGINLFQEGACGGTPEPVSMIKQLLAVKLRHLDSSNEIVRIFGKEVLEVIMKHNGVGIWNKPTIMITGRSTWPYLKELCIKMKLVTTNNSIKWFAFEYNKQYQILEGLFLLALSRMDEYILDDMVNRSYNIHSLLYKSHKYRLINQNAEAAELIERGLLAMETALHPDFSYTDGNCRLSYNYPENRPFFLLLFQYSLCMEGHALCRTALEVAKFLFNLNPDEDPLAMVLILDYYALRSEKYKWLIKFYEEFHVSKDLSILPNMLFSYALALFLFNGVDDKSNNALRNAILKYPAVLPPLLSALGVNDQYIHLDRFFSSPICMHQKDTLDYLISLYVSRGKHIWRASNAVKWLELNVRYILDLVEGDSTFSKSYDDDTCYDFHQPPVKILRHIILSNCENWESMFVFDPFPPDNEEDDDSDRLIGE